MSQHEKINYLEIPAKDLSANKAFFTQVFAWQFTDYGKDYTAFSNAGIKGGFYQTDLCAKAKTGSALIVFYSENLENTLSKIQNAKAVISQPIFSFPGGRRFHFLDPNGNEYAVWSE